MNRRLSDIVVLARGQACEACAEPCTDYRSGTLDLDDPCRACPLGAWAEWDCTRVESVAAAEATAQANQVRIRGLGDLVHLAAKPVVAAVRAATAGAVDLEQCGGCKGRRARWNAAVPFGEASATPSRRPRDPAAERPNA